MSTQRRLRALAGCLKASEDGQILVMYAVMIVALIGLAGLIIDVGIIFVERQELQAIADGAALAGAMDVNLMILANGTNCFQVNPVTSWGAANKYCSDHDVDCEISVIPDLTCSRTGIAIDSVTVTAKRDIDRFFFIQIVTGGDPIELKATATAKMVDDF